MRKLLLLMALAACAFANDYTVERKSTSSTAEVITVQLASNASKSARFDFASVYCSVEAEFTLERDGTAATTTSVTPTKVNPGSPAAAATAYRSSNVGSSTVFGRHVVPAGGTVVVDMRDKGLLPGENFTVRTSHASGTVIINVKWREF